MQRYLAKRVAHGLVVIYVVATVVFLAVRSVPGDPARLLLGGDARPSAIEALREQMNLDEPVHVQYINWMTDITQGDLGTSFFSNQPVLEMIVGVIEPTLSIGTLGMLIAVSIALPAGIISALRRYQPEDYVATILAFLGLSMPEFWIGILLVLVFATTPIPIYGYTAISQGLVSWLSHIILPAIAVGVPYGAILMRMVRSSMLEVMSEDYVRTARAKGLDENLVVFKHGLQNALIPVVTVAGILFAVLLGGVVAVELVFGVSGFGRLLIGSIQRRDFPVIQGSVITISFLFVGMNLVIDFVYTLINPQIRYGGES
ncbi:ABC transporter permease [Haloplanus sp. GCM10025708]|uniref:ABC transporter permease n=1 Tax=Haloferacaceae TaxID=1644056 RepID=UPI00361941FA